MANQKASRDVVDLVTRPITQGIDVDGDGSSNFRIDGTGIGLSSAADAAFTEITMSGRIDMAGQRINNVSTPLAGTDAVNRDYVTSGDASTLSSANAYTDAQVGGVPSPSDPTPPGAIMAYGGTSAPLGWLMCDGSPYNTTTYADLFAAIGGTFGSSTPDLRGRVIAGPDAGAGRMTGGFTTHGAAGGTEEQLPHTHPFSGTTSLGSADQPASGGAFTGSSETHIHSFGGTTSDDSGNRSKIQPTMIMNYIIKT